MGALSSFPKEQRLNKVIALRAGISRRQADELIQKGSVKLNGQTAQLGNQVTQNDVISLSGQNLDPDTPYQYLAFNKPVGLVCSRQKQGNTDTIYSALPVKFHHLKPVGRLDRDSSGLLFLTNDGDWAHRMTHPKFIKQKTYEITLNRSLATADEEIIKKGVRLDDGKSHLTLKKINPSDRKNWRVVMHEGRNRQIRRTFAARGYNVDKLHRVSFGVFSLTQLKLNQNQWLETKPD